MDTKDKLRAIVDYEKLSESVLEQIKLEYPRGFSQHLIQFKNRAGKYIKGLRFEMEDKIYLIRMTTQEAIEIVNQDDDYDDDGNLITNIKEDYEEKHLDVDLEDEENAPE